MFFCNCHSVTMSNAATNNGCRATTALQPQRGAVGLSHRGSRRVLAVPILFR